MKIWNKIKVPKIYPEYVFTDHPSLEEHKDIEHYSKHTNRTETEYNKLVKIKDINIVIPTVESIQHKHKQLKQKPQINWVSFFANMNVYSDK
jgi:hypothetical protein